ncbi:molybdopterin-dependent oxidoreductase [Leptolyngbya sp. FACHB-36]|uniref:molybdopterin-dependent oxidoreductase n=1 Tax=Leptolyngbya sp. FACHB-36 TaxID=2692808 RepID=UPI001680BD6F|nr:molybdopterin cofactor-binding domain-containing protein [Leptolyngbya sp. FACHB-36]MBD2019473.1 molybdopterin-dependent oxidoreductase [Leptolyngbya sp. FACHB-36]
MTASLTVHLNGQLHTGNCSPGTSLLSWLRQMGCASVHRVCESGDCGACTVWLDGAPIHSCLYPALRAQDHAVTTIEGLAQNGQLTPMQQAFLEHQGFQCGFCTPGMILSAEKLSFASEEELRLALRGSLCRCTGYQAIVESILAGKQAVAGGQSARGSGDSVTAQVGQSVPKQDGPDIVTGKPVYTSDYAPSGLLHLKVLRSPHPHAHIREIRTEQAEALPGVHAVLTYKDVDRRAYSTAGHSEPVPDPLDHYILDRKVRFIGDRVAAVVAESVAIAERACQLIEVEYEILPHVIDPIEAMGKGTVQHADLPSPPILHDEPESSQIFDAANNLAAQVTMESGDLEEGFAEADFVLETTYTVPAVQHTHLEPHVSTSWLDDDGTLVVRSSTQVPFHCQRVLSELFGLPKEKVRVYKAKLGGGFGNKQEILSEDLCVLATLKTGRPVQWEFTRQEEFTCTNSRHAATIRLKTGVMADGTLVAQELEAVCNTGAYGNHAPTVLFLVGYAPLALYRSPHKRFTGYSVYTNTMPAGAFRGYGATQGGFAMECQLDTIADKLGLDPVEVRLKNLIRPGDVVEVGRGRTPEDHFNLIGSYCLEECFAKVVQAIGYRLESPPIVEGPLRRGMGMAVSMQGSGLSKIHTACVNLSLEPTGRFCLRTGAVDVGTGSDTTLRQIAAHVLGATVADIDLVASDTHTTPFDAGSYASATLYISGQAVKLAAEKLRDKLNALEIPPSSPISVEAEYAADESSLTFAVQAVEVEVDTETGKVRLLRSVQAIDLGTAINPRICMGQAAGGSAMGIGYALSEELLFDDRGRILNPGFRNYRIPTAADVPPMQVFLVESEDPYGPFGAKGVGEITMNCMAPAIANAIAHATGARVTQLPMTPERVLAALSKAAP